MRARDREQPLVQQHAEYSLGLERVSVLGEGPLHERLGFLAGMLLLLACLGLCLRGCDRLVLGLDRRTFVRLRDFARLCFLVVRLGEFSVERLQRRGKHCRPGRDRESHQHDGGSQAGDSGVALTPSPEPLGGAHGAGDDWLAVEEAAQVRGHRGGIREAPGGVFLEGLQADRRQVCRHLGLEPRGRDRLLVPGQLKRLERGRPLERGSADEHLVKNRSQRILVAQRADLVGLAPRLLRRHVGRGAHDDAGAGLLRVSLHLLGQAEVRDLGLAVERQEDVGRFQVSVDNARRVRHGHRATELHHHRSSRSRRLRLAADQLGETAPGDEFQGEVREPLVVAVFVDLDDSRVLDLGDGAGLDVESRDLVGRGVRPGKDHFERDQAIQPDVPGFVDDAHAASADLRDDLVARHGQPDGPRPLASRRDWRSRVIVRRFVAREDLDRPGSRVRRRTSAGHLRVDRRGRVERFAHAGRWHIHGLVHAGRRRDLCLGDGGAALAWIQVQRRRRGRCAQVRTQGPPSRP